jgi:hypothetical protein
MEIVKKETEVVENTTEVKAKRDIKPIVKKVLIGFGVAALGALAYGLGKNSCITNNEAAECDAASTESSDTEVQRDVDESQPE